jgi:hypothetical protein
MYLPQPMVNALDEWLLADWPLNFTFTGNYVHLCIPMPTRKLEYLAALQPQHHHDGVAQDRFPRSAENSWTAPGERASSQERRRDPS